MIRMSRLALLSSCGLALCACTTVQNLTPHFGHGQRPSAITPSKSSAHARTPLAAQIWPQAYVDLPPDPAIRFGVLSNGMRYAVMKNATPSGQASLRLHISAGSLNETDAQQGLAHFLEHMAFNGSTHVARGEMIKTLERHGLAFGADTNASTSWEETVYKLDLPKADDDTVDVSLMLLREIGGELTLDQSAIDSEKGVVLSEERLRDTPGYRVLKSNFGLTLQGQLAAKRFPIGRVDVIQNATHDQLEAFYRAYYRPERAVLIAVGDFDVDAMEARIKAKFGDWTNAAPPGVSPNLGAPLRRGPQARISVEPGAPQSLQISWVARPDLSPDGKARRRRELIEQLGLAVLNRRLDRLVRADEPPFISAATYHSDAFHSAAVTTLSVTARPGEWRKALDAAETEKRRLLQYGVLPEELAVEIDSDRATLKAEVKGAATRTTPSVAEDVVATLNQPEVETSPAEDLALFEEAVKGLKPADVAQAIKAAFSGSGPLILLSSPQPVEGGEKALAAAFAATEKARVAPPSIHTALRWPYTEFGELGVVAEQHDVADLDAVFVRFQNGVRLTIKPTKFRNDQILVQARIGDGQLDLPSDRSTSVWAASNAFPEGGLDQISAEDMDQVLRSRIVGHDFGVGEDAFQLSGTTRPEDLETQLQLFAAYVSHPGWRPEAFQRMRNYAPTLLDQLGATPAGVLNRDLARLLHSGDRRWGLPSRQDIAVQTPESLKALLEPSLEKGPIEVVVVGDVTVEKAIDAVSTTFGALPARPDPVPPPAQASVIAFPSPTAAPILLTHAGRADQAVGFAAWPTEDFLSDTQRARTLSILSAVLQLRLTDQLRKVEGATYSPSASSQNSQTYPHYGYLSARVEIPPGKLDGFFADLASITADLRDRTISSDELNRAKGPAVDALEQRRQTNEYWISALAGAQTDPRRLTAIRTSEAQLRRVSAEDVRKAAQTYLVDDKAWKLEVKPAPK